MTPKPYISWSQMDLFEKSPKKYADRYLYGEVSRTNRGQAVGKDMATALERGTIVGDPVMDMVIVRLPKFELMDVEMWAEIPGSYVPKKKILVGQVPILFRPDSAKEDLSAFKEYKTGQEKWTKRQVDQSGQITFYAMCMYLKTGKVPKDIELVHVETKQVDEVGRIEATGNIYRHPTTRTMVDVLTMMARTRKAWEGIKALCEEELL